MRDPSSSKMGKTRRTQRRDNVNKMENALNTPTAWSCTHKMVRKLVFIISIDLTRQLKKTLGIVINYEGKEEDYFCLSSNI